MNWRKLLLTTLALGLLGATTVYGEQVQMDLFYNGKHHAYAAKEVKIEIDGKAMVPKDMPAVIIDGRTMLPMRQIAQELGCEVNWNEAAKQIYVMRGSDIIVFTVDSKTGYENGKEFTMDVPATIVNDRTMLPVRALADALHLNIKWDDPNRIVSIQSGDTVVKDEPKAPESGQTTAGTLTGIQTPSAKDADQTFTIQADGPMGRYEKTFVDDQKIVLDFYGAKSSLPSEITKTNSDIVTGIRTATHENNGDSFTRVVFDLSGKKDYEVTQSADKKNITISFGKTTVDKISAVHSQNKDIITIGGTGSFGASVAMTADPQKIIVTIPNCQSNLSDKINTDELQYVLDGKVDTSKGNTVELVLAVEDLVQYSYREENQNLILEIYPTTLKNMRYDKNANVLYLDKKEKIDTGSVKFEDHYLDGYFDVTLPGDYESDYGYGTYDVKGTVVENIEVSTKGGNTTFRFKQNRISAYEVTDEGDSYAIRVKNPKEVYDKVLLLDAGHGGKDPGTSGNGMQEKNLNLTIAQKIAQKLQGSGIKVYMTRDSDVYPENSTRAKTANDIADLMVSIHMNSGPETANGTETLYQVHANDNGARLTSKQLAEILQGKVVSATGNTNRGAKLWTDVLILNRTTVPSVIVEVIFITNTGDALKISNPAYQDQVAQAIADGIQEAVKYPLR
ncbi:N-acetylmuramoyl-L-alanine amidase family protein [Anaerotignum lactatifermentans]|uniref:N-acetylmuramoyl-L-alanine amidase family protein n=1 Tax=Anaerotignum lactatifermentans TaxID=160404 RepID=UPI00187550FD|nr:N-acetylmuramoyl-L-alanine amidase family protein [Anaerotignum lactatifermentans]MBE5076497.1 N-acetylmuramoyl-L-alanine amidase [Anaerotignum lactatifermentans]